MWQTVRECTGWSAGTLTWSKLLSLRTCCGRRSGSALTVRQNTTEPRKYSFMHMQFSKLRLKCLWWLWKWPCHDRVVTLLIFMCQMWAAHGPFYGLWSLNQSLLVCPSPLSVHRTRTPHFTFSITVDRIGASNTYTFTRQDTFCMTHSTQHDNSG